MLFIVSGRMLSAFLKGEWRGGRVNGVIGGRSDLSCVEVLMAVLATKI